MQHDKGLTQGYMAAGRILAMRQPEYEPRGLLRRALAEANGESDKLALAAAALDLAEPECAAVALAQLPDGPAQSRLQQRAEHMFALSRLPQPARPKDWAPVPGRVAYVLYSSLPWISTGYALRSQHLASALHNDGADLQCLTRPGFPWDEDPTVLLTDLVHAGSFEEEVSSLSYLRTPEPQFGNWQNYPTYVRESADMLTLRFLDLRPEVVMAASNHACALPAQIAARRLDLPMAYEMRGFWELSRTAREPEFLGTPQYRYERWLETQVALQADHVFTLSQPMRQTLMSRGLAAEGVTFLPNGCDPAHFAPTGHGKRLAADLNLPEGVPVIGYAGSFPAYEGLEDLIAVAARLKTAGHRFRLVLVGDEKGTGVRGTPVSQTLRRQAVELGLGDWCVMPGRVPPEQVAHWLEVFDICVFPRRPLPVTETVAPLKPVEAMAAGKAIVLSSVGGMQGLLKDGESGLVFAKGDREDLQRQLTVLLTNAELRAQLGHKARQRAQLQYSWSRIADIMNDRLNRLVQPC
ncbi:glycosyltransferase family 4 protein [Pseudophaeobacter sp. 1A16562]|uniref:glycosyltransferase family 4 protein n=1 Tax=Pseudophaeobacter sp. 1A16562 TaxID=3098143 RepID=UPI0034D4A8DF